MNSRRKHEKAFDQDLCQQYIKDALDDMKHSNYDFCYSSLQPFVGKTKQMLRNSVYLRFNCFKCQEKGRQKRFTTTLGTVSIRFQLQKLSNYPYEDLIVFRIRIYRMRCLQCKKYGYPQIYDSQLEIIQKRFCQIVGEILEGIPPKQRIRNKKPIKVPDLKVHQHSQCQACQQKKCHPGDCIQNI